MADVVHERRRDGSDVPLEDLFCGRWGVAEEVLDRVTYLVLQNHEEDCQDQEEEKHMEGEGGCYERDRGDGEKRDQFCRGSGGKRVEKREAMARGSVRRGEGQ